MCVLTEKIPIFKKTKTIFFCFFEDCDFFSSKLGKKLPKFHWPLRTHKKNPASPKFSVYFQIHNDGSARSE